MSLVQHLADAGLPLAAGWNGLVHLALSSGMATMLVVVCRSHWLWRHTSSRSLVKATSHSSTPAPMRAPARFDSSECSGNCSGAPPRWPMDQLDGFMGFSVHCCSVFLSGPSVMLLT